MSNTYPNPWTDQQIEKVVKHSICLYGGVSHEIQEIVLKRANPHILIATSSRVKTSLSRVDYIVVDENGFRYRLRSSDAITVPLETNPYVLCHWWPPSVQTLSDQFLNHFIHINVSKTKSLESMTINKNIEQKVKVCGESDQLVEDINELVPKILSYLKTIIIVRPLLTSKDLSSIQW